MNKTEKQELLERIAVLEYGNAQLRKNYLNAQKETATAIYGSCCELAKWQGDVVYDVDFWDIFTPWGVEVAEEYRTKQGVETVVLTGTEEHLEDLLIEFDEMGFYPATLIPNPEECASGWKRKLIYAIGQIRKETAEKLSEKLHKKLEPYIQPNTLYTQREKELFKIFLDKFDEICKEITEGKYD